MDYKKKYLKYKAKYLQYKNMMIGGNKEALLELRYLAMDDINRRMFPNRIITVENTGGSLVNKYPDSLIFYAFSKKERDDFLVELKKTMNYLTANNFAIIEKMLNKEDSPNKRDSEPSYRSYLVIPPKAILYYVHDVILGETASSIDHGSLPYDSSELDKLIKKRDNIKKLGKEVAPDVFPF